jgi:hypothetical protein
LAGDAPTSRLRRFQQREDVPVSRRNQLTSKTQSWLAHEFPESGCLAEIIVAYQAQVAFKREMQNRTHFP